MMIMPNPESLYATLIHEADDPKNEETINNCSMSKKGFDRAALVSISKGASILSRLATHREGPTPIRLVL